MPNVQIKYQLTLDATVTLVPHHFFIQATPFTPANTTGGDNLPSNIVYAAGDLTIDMMLSGPAGQWKIAVWVMKIDPVSGPTGVWKPLLFNGTSEFTGDISNKNLLVGDFDINLK